MQRTTARAHALPERVLVLGGMGFVGSAVVKQFLKQGCAVSVVARRPQPIPANSDLEGVQVHILDASDRDALEQALLGVDHVVYALGTPFAGRADTDPIGNVFATMPPLLHLLEALRTRSGTGLSFLSSGGTVYGNPPVCPVPESAPCRPITGYGVMKITAERYLDMYRQVHGVPSRVLRVANAYGPLQPSGRGQGLIAELFRCARDGGRIAVFGDGETVRDYLSVDDVAWAVVALSSMQGGPNTLNVGSGLGHSVNTVIETFESVTGVKIVRDYRTSRVFDVEQIVLDVSLLRSVISWQPLVLKDGLARAWDSLRSDCSSVRV